MCVDRRQILRVNRGWLLYCKEHYHQGPSAVNTLILMSTSSEGGARQVAGAGQLTMLTTRPRTQARLARHDRGRAGGTAQSRRRRDRRDPEGALSARGRSRRRRVNASRPPGGRDRARAVRLRDGG
jgi:hypothetical protein